MSTELAKLEAVNGALEIRDVHSSMEFARLAFKSGLVPSTFKSPEAIMIACQQGAELGLKPMASLNVIAVINGRPSLWGRGIPALCENSGKMESWSEWIEGSGDNMVAFCKSKRRGIDGERVSSFSVQEAKQANLWGKGNWAMYPKDQLCYKARARCLGILYADVLCGLPVYEDIAEVPPERKEPRTVPVNDPLLDSPSGVAAVEVEQPIDPAPGGENPDDLYRRLKADLESCETAQDLEKCKVDCANKKELLSADHKNSLKEIYAENAKRIKG